METVKLKFSYFPLHIKVATGYWFPPKFIQILWIIIFKSCVILIFIFLYQTAGGQQVILQTCRQCNVFWFLSKLCIFTWRRTKCARGQRCFISNSNPWNCRYPCTTWTLPVIWVLVHGQNETTIYLCVDHAYFTVLFHRWVRRHIHDIIIMK